MKLLLCLILTVVGMWCLIFFIGLPRYEKAECIKWKNGNYPYYTDWQIKQCLNYGIILKGRKTIK